MSNSFKLYPTHFSRGEKKFSGERFHPCALKLRTCRIARLTEDDHVKKNTAYIWLHCILKDSRNRKQSQRTEIYQIL